MIIGDLEADGLLDTATQVWCATFYNTEDKITHWITFDDYKNDTALCVTQIIDQFMESGNTISFHNGVCYDIPLLEKLVPGWKFKGKLFDTLFASRILWPDRVGGHGLASWGETFGIPKPKHEDWSKFSEEMLYRNQEDVKIATKLSQNIIQYVTDLSILDSRIKNSSFSKVLSFEQEVAKIIEEQANNGWLFDLEAAYRLESHLNEKIEQIKAELLPNLPMRVIRPSQTITKAFKADGTYTENTKKWLWSHRIENDDYNIDFIRFETMVGGDFSKVRFEQLNLNSSEQVKDYLLANGWKPKEFNFKKDRFNKVERDKRGNPIKTTPKIPKKVEEWEALAVTINNPSIKQLAEYNKAKHRYGQVKGLINNVRPHDHRIEAQANSCGTNTTRMQHRIVVNIPKSDPKVYYGKEMRSLFICPKGKVLVGIDASALEARVEASYIYPFDPAGAMELIEGDIHTKNANIFDVSRDLAKSGKYALTYGCAPAKLSATLHKPSSEADILYNAYWEGNPGLKELKERVEEAYEKHGYLLAIDGRPLTIRYKHALINTLFQSAGSIIMKKALILLKSMLEFENLQHRVKFVGNFHDEMQLECDPEVAELVGKLGVKSIKEAAEFYKMKVPFTGEFKVGRNWAETH